MKRLLLCLFALTLAAAPALADGPAKDGHGPRHCAVGKDRHSKGGMPMMEGMFDKMDLNHDGKVTEKEFLAFHKKMFSKMDANHDGAITMDEMKAAHEKMMQKMMEKHRAFMGERGGWQGSGFTNRPVQNGNGRNYDDRGSGLNQ